MKKIILTFITSSYLSLPLLIGAQGLFSNGDFENHSDCPSTYGQIENLFGVTKIAKTPDYFNTCNFDQNSCRTILPFSGNGCIGMFGGPWSSTTTQQELASLNLDAATVIGTTYELNFYLLGENNGFAPCYQPGAGACFNFGFFFYKSTDNYSWPNPTFFAQGTFPEPHIFINGADIIPDSWNAYNLQFLADSDYDRVLFGWFPNSNSYTNACLTPSSNDYTGYAYMDKLCIDVLGNNCPICSYNVDITTAQSSICPNETVINLNSATFGGVNTVEWTTNGSGTFSNINSANTSYTLSASDLQLSSIKFLIKTDDPAGNCDLAKDSIEMVFSNLDSINFVYPQSTICLPSPNILPQVFVNTSGSFSINNNGIIDPNTGEINLNQSGEGQFTISFISSENCVNQKDFQIEIKKQDSINYVYPQSSVCLPSQNMLPQILVNTNGSFSIDNNGVINPISGEINLNQSGVGQYLISFTSSEDCINQKDFQLEIKNPDSINFVYPQTTICLPSDNLFPQIFINTPGFFSMTNNGIIDPNTGEININESGIGQYIVSFTSSQDCINQKDIAFTICDENSIDTLVDPELVIPTIFTPNNDQINDLFVIEHSSINQLELLVLNRWGNVVFQTNELNKHWNGKDQSGKDLTEGVYFYRLKVQFLSGNQKEYSGYTTLVR